MEIGAHTRSSFKGAAHQAPEDHRGRIRTLELRDARHERKASPSDGSAHIHRALPQFIEIPYPAWRFEVDQHHRIARQPRQAVREAAIPRTQRSDGRGHRDDGDPDSAGHHPPVHPHVEGRMDLLLNKARVALCPPVATLSAS